MSQISVHVQPVEDHVVLTFSQSVGWLKMTPDEARNIAQLITNAANSIAPAKLDA